MMGSNDMDAIMKRGAIGALTSEIRSKIHVIQNSAFDATMSEAHFVRLGNAIAQVRVALDSMDELLKALNKLDGKSK